jgi:hypothetical protein
MTKTNYFKVCFISEDADVTASHLQLIGIAAYIRVVKVFGKCSYQPELAEHRPLKSAVLQLWEKALPLLVVKPYTCAYTVC